MSSSRTTMSAYRSTTSKHSSDGSGEDNSGHLLGLNYPKSKVVVDHNSDPAYILASLAALPSFPTNQPSQSPSASTSASSAAPQPSLVPLPVTLNPPLPAAIPDTCPPLLFSLLSSASTHLLSSHLAQARAALDDAALLVASPQLWDGLTEGNWKELVAEDKRRRDEWDEYERRSLTAAYTKEPLRPAKLQIADGDAVSTIAEEDGTEKEDGEKSTDAQVAAGDADSPAAVQASSAAATPSQPAEIPTLTPITQLIFAIYFPLCCAQIAQAEGNEQDALLFHWKAWLAHEQYVTEQEKGAEEERKRGEEAQRRARGGSAAEDDDGNDDATNSAGGTSTSSATSTHAHTIQPFTFPSPLSATVLYCLGLSALHMRNWQAGLRAFGVAFRVQCATIDRATREFVDVASTMHNIAVCLGCAGDGSSGDGWAAAWQWMKAAEELMVARLPGTHPRLLQLRANLAAITPLRASLQPDAMRAMMDGMDEARRQKEAEAEVLRAAKAKKGGKKGAADQPSPASSVSPTTAALLSGKKSEWPIIEGFGQDGNWFQQPVVEEAKETVVAAPGESVVVKKDEQVWLRRWTVETTPYEKMLVDSKKAAGGAADGKKAKAGKGAKKGKAK